MADKPKEPKLPQYTRRHHTHRHIIASRATPNRWPRDYKGCCRMDGIIGTPEDVILIDAPGITAAMGTINI